MKRAFRGLPVPSWSPFFSGNAATPLSTSEIRYPPQQARPEKTAAKIRGPPETIAFENLLLVVNRGAADFFAAGIRARDDDSASLAIRCNRDRAAERNFPVFFIGKRHGSCIDLLIRPRVGGRVTGNRVIFAVEFAGPLTVRGFAVACYA